MREQMKQYRPYMGEPFEYVGWRLAEKLNEMSMDNFDDLAAHRRADYELWKRILPDESFPKDAAKLLKRFDIDPNFKIVQSV
jgi:hypothetical protein